MFIIDVSAAFLFLSCLLLGDTSTLCTMFPTAPARGIYHLWCAAKLLGIAIYLLISSLLSGAMKKSKAMQDSSSNINF